MLVRCKQDVGDFSAAVVAELLAGMEFALPK